MAKLDDSMPLGRIFTLHEAAEYLGITIQAVSKTARRIGACSTLSREIRSSESDVAEVWNSQRVAPNDGSEYLRDVPDLASEKARANLHKRAADRRQARLADRERRRLAAERQKP